VNCLRIANIAGIQLILNYWFIAVIILFYFAGMSSKVLLLFSAVLLHELAHAGVARLLGYRVCEVELLPFGGVARIEGVGVASSKGEITIAAAGPAASLVLAALVYGSMLVMNMWTEVGDFYYKANLMLAVFNLVPGLPLDGGRIFRAGLALYIDYGRATLIATAVSKWLSACLTGVAIYQYATSSTINITFLMAAVFLYITAKSEVRVAGFRTLQILAQKKAFLTARGIMTTTHFTVMENVLLKDIIKMIRSDQYYVMLVVNGECKVCGTLTETEIWEGLPGRGLYACIGELVQ
jgi:stage IV sporulation protein FB